MKEKFLIIISFLISVAAIAQEFYKIDQINEIELVFTDPDWNNTLIQYYNNSLDERLLATCVINGTQLDSVGVKYKGNSTYSPGNDKNPLNIKLDYVKNQDYLGFESLKLSTGNLDPSFVREVMCYEIARKYMVAPRANYAKVFINGNFHGLYSSAEVIDGNFQEKYLKADSENTRFKCNPESTMGSNGCSLEYLGQDSSLYFSLYELKSDYGWNDLVDLTNNLSNNFSAVNSFMNLDNAIWMLAFNNVLVNLDSYLGPFRQNYYLIKDDFGRMCFVVWDMNENMGGFEQINSGPPGPSTNLSTVSPYLREGLSAWPLISQVLDNDRYKRMYMAHFRTIFNENIANDWYINRANELQDLIDADYQSDPNSLYSYNDFKNNLNSTIGTGNSAIGLTELMTDRISYLEALPEFSYTLPEFTNQNIEVSGDSLIILINVSDAFANSVFYRFSIGEKFIEKEMFDDGLHNDGDPNDQVFGVKIPYVSGGGVLFYYYAENTNAGAFSPERAAYEYHYFEEEKSIVINELMASNSFTASDNEGEFDDWIELYNNTANSIDLTGWFLSDDNDEKDKWQFPDTAIEANSYLIIWADDDIEQGLHANFKLSAAGEGVVLSDSDTLIVDMIQFPALETDFSYARIPNGTGSFSISNPTFNENNDGNQSLISHNKSDDFVIYPNPASGFVFVKTARMGECSVFDFSGRKILTKKVYKDPVKFDVSQFKDGLYFVKFNKSIRKLIVSK